MLRDCGEQRVLVVIEGKRHFLPGVVGVDFNALWAKYLRGGGAKMFMMVKGSCAALKATCGWPPQISNCIRTHLRERYDVRPKPVIADI